MGIGLYVAVYWLESFNTKYTTTVASFTKKKIAKPAIGWGCCYLGTSCKTVGRNYSSTPYFNGRLIKPQLTFGHGWEMTSHRKCVMTSSNISRVTGPLCRNSPVTGEFPAQRPVTRSFGVFYDLHLNTRLSKQSLGWWFETPSRPLWRYCYGMWFFHALI